MQILDKAVGAGVPGTAQDVARVQELLAIAGFGTDAETSSELPDQIKAFQRNVVGLKVADGRVDPLGLTMARLLAEAKKQVFLRHRVSRCYEDPRVTATLAASLPNIVIGDIQKPHLISPLTHGALRLLGYCCGVSQMKITEGIRTYEMMASYFLRKITDGSKGIRGDSYRHALEILAEHNKGQPYAAGNVPQQHMQAVADRMRKRCEEAKARVSMHVVSEPEYQALNVVDLGWASNPMLQDLTRARVFASLLDSFHAKNKQAQHKFVGAYYPPHHLNHALDSPYGKEIKIENAWHVEFVVAEIPPVLG